MTERPVPTAPPPVINPPTLTKLLYDIPEAAALLSLSRTVVYDQMTAGRLRSVRQGRARRIPAAAILDYVTLLQNEAAQEARS